MKWSFHHWNPRMSIEKNLGHCGARWHRDLHPRLKGMPIWVVPLDSLVPHTAPGVSPTTWQDYASIGCNWHENGMNHVHTNPKYAILCCEHVHDLYHIYNFVEGWAISRPPNTDYWLVQVPNHNHLGHRNLQSKRFFHCCWKHGVPLVVNWMGKSWNSRPNSMTALIHRIFIGNIWQHHINSYDIYPCDEMLMKQPQESLVQ